jgi:dienelactone hydrolase
MRRLLLSLVFIVGGAALACAEIKTQVIEYKQGSTVLEGYLAYDDKCACKRPGILVAHEWMGLNDYAKERARMLAELGFRVFAVDIYGKGVRPATVEEAAALSTKFKNDRELLRKRMLAGLEVLKSQPNVNLEHLAAIGYCFGGTAVLELARSGADVKAIVSFHGGLSSPNPKDAKKIKGEILVLHGTDDPFVLPAEVAAFEKEMNDAQVKYQLIRYPGAVHGFTNPANKGEIPGALYNQEADQQSWQAMKDFFTRILRRPVRLPPLEKQK